MSSSDGRGRLQEGTPKFAKHCNVEGQWNVTTLKISLMNFPSSGVFKNTYDLRD